MTDLPRRAALVLGAACAASASVARAQGAPPVGATATAPRTAGACAALRPLAGTYRLARVNGVARAEYQYTRATAVGRFTDGALVVWPDGRVTQYLWAQETEPPTAENPGGSAEGSATRLECTAAVGAVGEAVRARRALLFDPGYGCRGVVALPARRAGVDHRMARSWVRARVPANVARPGAGSRAGAVLIAGPPRRQSR